MSRKATNPQNLKDKGFDKHPENINKSGRPKKLPDLEPLLSELLGDHLTGSESMKGIIIALRKKAASGDVRAAELLLDRAYGKLKQSTGLEIDILKLSDGQLDQIINRLIKKEDVKESE